MSSENPKSSPPRWAVSLLRFYCKPAMLEDLEGDLQECFDRNEVNKGKFKAKAIYILQVLRFFRPYTIRRPQLINILIQWIMIGSYIKTSGRNIVRNKLFSAINVVGLAVSMSVGLLMIAFIKDVRSYDAFHENKDRIYRVTSLDARDNDMKLATTSLLAGKKIQEGIAGLESVVMLGNGFGGDAHIGETVLPIGGYWASESLFSVFTFPMLQGNPATALKDPYSIVISENEATRLFGTKEALGKTLTIDSSLFTITGVFQTMPKLSHWHADVLASFSTHELKKWNHDPTLYAWNNIYSHYVYVLLPKDGDPKLLQQNLDRLSSDENKLNDKSRISLLLQPMPAITGGQRLGNEIGASFHPVAIWIMAGLAFVVILSAAFNYTNLSIARSLKRSREVGIRKVVGARKSHVLAQFMTESVIISLIALCFAVVLFFFLRAGFLGLHEFISGFVSLEITPSLAGWFIVLAVGVGITAGFLPAMFFARINAIQVLKDASTLRVFKNVSMRKALIVAQYIFSLIFITSTIIGFKQYQGLVTFDLGYKTENILNIKMQGNRSDVLKKELLAIPEVSDISISRMITSIGSIYGTQTKYHNGRDSAGVSLNYVDEHYIPLHNHLLIAGRNFNSVPEKVHSNEIIVNEALVKEFNLGSTVDKALGEVVVDDKKEYTIVGVVRNYHYGTLENKISPMIFHYTADETNGYLNVSLTSSDLHSTMEKIDRAWRNIDKTHQLSAVFYDDQIQQAYSQFAVMVKVIGFLSFLAICIASMGLFGMVVFTTETRLKEIGIRKVLGADEGKLILLLGRGFIVLLIVAAFVALPVTWWFFDNVVLTNFAYHRPIGFIDLLSGFIGVMLLALLMIGTQTFKAARTNPASVLKSE